MADGIKVVAENRKARHDYHIEETFEAGMVLTGTEVKSLRLGRANLRDSYAAIENGELFVYNMHISPYTHGNMFNHEPKRTRKLLMHKREIMRLLGTDPRKGLYPSPSEGILPEGGQG
jgi:SsrA-binding protein